MHTDSVKCFVFIRVVDDGVVNVQVVHQLSHGGAGLEGGASKERFSRLLSYFSPLLDQSIQLAKVVLQEERTMGPLNQPHPYCSML